MVQFVIQFIKKGNIKQEKAKKHCYKIHYLYNKFTYRHVEWLVSSLHSKNWHKWSKRRLEPKWATNSHSLSFLYGRAYTYPKNARGPAQLLSKIWNLWSESRFERWSHMSWVFRRNTLKRSLHPRSGKLESSWEV